MFALSLCKHKKAVKSAPSSHYWSNFSMVLIWVMMPWNIKRWTALVKTHWPDNQCKWYKGSHGDDSEIKWKNTQKALAGVGHHALECVQIGILYTHRAVFFSVRLVASCATVTICADVTGCWLNDIKEKTVRKAPVFLLYFSINNLNLAVWMCPHTHTQSPVFEAYAPSHC